MITRKAIMILGMVAVALVITLGCITYNETNNSTEVIEAQIVPQLERMIPLYYHEYDWKELGDVDSITIFYDKDFDIICYYVMNKPNCPGYCNGFNGGLHCFNREECLTETELKRLLEE